MPEGLGKGGISGAGRNIGGKAPGGIGEKKAMEGPGVKEATEKEESKGKAAAAEEAIEDMEVGIPAEAEGAVIEAKSAHTLSLVLFSYFYPINKSHLFSAVFFQ